MTLSPKQGLEIETDYTVTCNIGGYGSGKTFNDFTLLLNRSLWDTGQRHGLFANTDSQATEGILPDLYELAAQYEIDHCFGPAPPASWVRRWNEDGISYPQRGPRSPHTWIWDTGLHVIVGGIGNGKFKRYKGYQFGSIILEEITEYPNADPFNFFLPRVRCGQWGSGVCAAQHRHQIYMRGNPPDPRRPHWIRGWVRDQREAEEKRDDGKKFFLFLQSSTYDNIENVGPEYIDRLRRGLDPETAEAMISGSLEQVSSSSTYHRFSRKNVIPIEYDPERPLYVALDFNHTPTAATLGHELSDAEVPEGQRGKGLTHVGVFGEVAYFGGMDATQLANVLLFGEPDKGGHWPANFAGLVAHQHRVYMYGDPSGFQRRFEARANASAWKQVNALMYANLPGTKYIFDVPPAAPAVYDSVTLLNSMMSAADGSMSYWVDDRCRELIADYEGVVPKADGSDLIDKKDPKRTHWSDAERYKVWTRYKSQQTKLRTSYRDLLPIEADEFASQGTL